MPHEALDALLARLSMTIPDGWDLGLDRITRVLGAIGNPHLRQPPFIHVTGTNGKGSTTAYARAILEAAGRQVHVFTSPHLVRFNERIRIGNTGGGRLVSDDELALAIARAEAANAGGPITFFELTTVAAFLIFAEHPADVTLMEVGLGGRLDSTNVVPNPLACVFTPISMDHEKFLGDTVEKIASEKAGILKRGAVAVSAPQSASVTQVIERQADRLSVPVILGGQDWSVATEHGRLVYQDEGGLLDLPPPRLMGRHQYVNAGTAIATLRATGLAPDVATIARGMANVDWPARMQRLAFGPIVDMAPPGAEVWLDGGHNPGCGEVIAATIADLEERVARPLFLITGMLETKDPIGFFKPFAGLTRHVFTVPIPGDHRNRPPAELAAAARKAGLTAEPMAGVAEALSVIDKLWRLRPAPRILICGSLYLAGEVLKANGTLPE
ncbi:MAG: bifunctional folylpolyglutamate synthase/dihydrofolate synthase [Ancalomicrobiaceae bacterium]|nr:bifunctional folylpolyglutamate synthase/dihydrofolate synthase [Ancalomicrobiaceae bacterium]